MKIPFIARLVRKSDGAAYSAEFEARPDVASALIVAYERFGIDHRIVTVYPKDHSDRVGWPGKMAAAAMLPV